MGKRLTLFTAFLALSLIMSIFSGCTAVLDRSDSVNRQSVDTNQKSVEKTEIPASNNALSTSDAISILAEDGKVWQVEGSMWHAYKFTVSSNGLDYTEYDHGQYHEGSISFSADGTELYWSDKNGTMTYYWTNDTSGMEYNNWHLSNTNFSFGLYDRYVKVNESASVFNLSD